MQGLWSEIKRRNLFRVAAAYLIVSWLLVQIASILAPALLLPAWAVTVVVYFAVLGFPFALFFAWAFELTPEGLKPTQSVDPEASVTGDTGKSLNRIIVGLMAVAIVFLLVDKFIPETKEAVAPEIEVVEEIAPLPEDRVRESIAVLPFVNMSADADQEYFSDGISEELLNLLAKTKGLRVAARTSSFAFKGQNTDIKEIGKQLAVETVLEGSVRRSGQMLRITAQLIDVETGYHLWSDTYDRELSNIFAIQDEISEAIVQSLQVHLTGVVAATSKSRETDFEAYNNYLIGRSLITRRDEQSLIDAMANFDKAIAVDPDYAPAYSRKAIAVLLSSTDNYGKIEKEEAFRIADALITRALELDPNDSAAFAALGLMLRNQAEERMTGYEAAQEALEKAIELNPNDADAHMWLGSLYAYLGRAREGQRLVEKAMILDPLNHVARSNLHYQYYENGHPEKAQKLIEETEQLFRGEPNKSFRLKLNASYYEQEYARDYKTIRRVPTGFTDQSYIGLVQIATAFELWNDDEVRSHKDHWKFSVLAAVDGAEQTILSYHRRPDQEKSRDRELSLIPFYMKAGRYYEVIEFAESFGDEGMRPGYGVFSFQGFAEIFAPDVIVAYRRVGDDEKAERLLAALITNISVLEEAGRQRNIAFLKAQVHALQGNQEDALVQLQLSYNRGEIHRGELDRVAFDTIRDAEEFKAIEADYFAHVNAERAKLGWAPIDMPGSDQRSN